MYTFTAWEDARQRPRPPQQRRASGGDETFFGPEFAAGGQTGVWAPDRLNGLWVRCRGCDEMVRRTEAERCRCGAELPPSPRWW